MKQNHNNASRYAELSFYSRGQYSFSFPWNWFLFYSSPVTDTNNRMNLLSFNGANSI